MTAAQKTDELAETMGLDTAATMADPSGRAPSIPATPQGPAGRARTVLPRVEAEGAVVTLVRDPRVRYEHEKLLGEGGMGTVTLARDQDIDRHVALKQIHREAGTHGLARFVEEIRTIGRLEHPNIIPIHDVGVDDDGNYFFVMKYVEGETLEEVIERLAAGDAEAHRRYGFEARVNLFIGLLRALAFAHDRGIVHRDIKPANIMIGPYGEVVLMDWGIAKPIGAPDLPPGESEREEPVDDKDTRRRLVKTATSALVGTPAYMSPEQARGVSELDARSDIYSACVVFHELLTLRHYLSHAKTVPGVLLGVLDHDIARVAKVGAHSHPTQGIPPIEYLHFVTRGLRKKPEERWGSALEMIAELEGALEGKIRIQCPMSLLKRMTRETSRFVDRNPRTSVTLLAASALFTLLGVVGLAYGLVS